MINLYGRLPIEFVSRFTICMKTAALKIYVVFVVLEIQKPKYWNTVKEIRQNVQRRRRYFSLLDYLRNLQHWGRSHFRSLKGEISGESCVRFYPPSHHRVSRTSSS